VSLKRTLIPLNEEMDSLEVRPRKKHKATSNSVAVKLSPVSMKSSKRRKLTEQSTSSLLNF
jgi:hypothetical protein